MCHQAWPDSKKLYISEVFQDALRSWESVQSLSICIVPVASLASDF